MRKKLLVLTLSIVLIISLFTGCTGAKNTGNQETSAAQVNSETERNTNADKDVNADTVNEVNTDSSSSTSDINNTSNESKDSAEIGRVTAIDGYNITLDVNAGRGGQKQGGGPAGGQPKEPGNTTEQNSEAPLEFPSSDLPPKDEATKETQEKMVTLTEDTVINVADGDSTKTGTIDDITVGCMLSVTYTTDDSGNQIPGSVTIRNFTGDPKGQGPAGNNPPSDSAATGEDNN